MTPHSNASGLRRRHCLFAALPGLLIGTGPAHAAPLDDAMRRAEALRNEAVAAGDQAYGAVVLRGDAVVGAAPSRVVVANDPTAHAEMEANRDAARPSMVRASPQALVAAAEAGDTTALRRLLDAGTPVDAADNKKRSALLAATQANRIDAARLLIERGANVNAKDELQDSPFLYAGAEGRLEILRLTLAAGADVGSINRYGGTALIPAAHHGHVDNVRELLKTKIDVNHVNRLGWTALLEAIILGDGGAAHSEIVRLLVAQGANVNLADAQGVTPLAHAEQRGHAAMARELLRAGARR